MAADIKPGQWITVKVTSEPKSEGGKKTLIRLCEKDPVVKVERERLSRSRPVRWDPRGGRLWADRPPKLQVVKTTAGASYKIFASLEVLTALKSLAKHVELSPA